MWARLVRIEESHPTATSPDEGNKYRQLKNHRHMPTVTVSVDDSLKDRMDEHPEINWSQVARGAFKDKVEDLEMMERLSSDSELTEEDIDELAAMIDENVAERLAGE